MRKSTEPENPMVLLVRSGARGGIDQLVQLGGMRGELADINNHPLQPPVCRNYREGVSPLEYYLGAHAARRSMCEKKLVVAPAGDFTRLMVEAAYPLLIAGEDCGTKEGLLIYPFPGLDAAGFGGLKGLAERLVGRVAAESGELITEKRAQELEKANKPVRVRSVLSCCAEEQWDYGALCQRCYGWDLSRRDLPELGAPVGILAAQSIGERGTQLTMRTFHTGGAGGRGIIEGFPRMKRIFGNGEVELSLYKVLDPGDCDLNKGEHVDQWSLLLKAVRVEAGKSPPQVSLEDETCFRRPEEVLGKDGLEAFRTVLSYEAERIYKGAVDEKHFEVVARALLGKGEGLTSIRQAPFHHPGFLAAASFQRALTVLAEAALENRCDDLRGYKERLIVGKRMREEA